MVWGKNGATDARRFCAITLERMVICCMRSTLGEEHEDYAPLL